MYREYYGLVWDTARRFGVQDYLLDDTVQQVFIVVYRLMGSFDGHSPRAWLYSITRRVASNVRRSEYRATRLKDAARCSMQPTNSRPVEAMEAWQAVDRFVTGLPQRQREIFALSEIEGMSGAEVARCLGLPPSTTYDAIRALRRRFAEEMRDAPLRDELPRMASRRRPRASARSWSALMATTSRLSKASTFSRKLSWPAISSAVKATVAGLGLTAALAVGPLVNSRAPAPNPRRAAPVISASPSAKAKAPAAAEPTDPPATAKPPPETIPTVASAPTPRPQSRPRTDGRPHGPIAPRSLAGENALLRVAAAALAAGDPTRAITLADRHAREHADSPMVDVSTALRIESLCALGKQPQARGEASVFLRHRPNSPMADRIRSACPNISAKVP